jgi:2-polyprenyl-6-methoxyphenol hydroxylase-like FAD-dependent oxidoreductase
MDVIVTGGGIVGTCAAMLLAKDGHHVTVLERDAGEPPDDPRDAWTGWERRGVNQFRLLHYFQPRFREIVERELPEVVSALQRAGALRFSFIENVPESMSGGLRDGDERFASLTARRPVAEAAVAAVARETLGLDIRRGVAVAGLLTGPSAADGIPHVTGVRTEAGEELRADVVVDATGRRSPLPAWLSAIGAPPVDEEMDDSGFVYYGRYFRSGDGSVPPLMGPPLYYCGSVALLVLPADNGTWGIGVIALSGDKPLRGLTDTDRWTELVRTFPLHAHWLDGEPLDERVVTMAKLEDRRRRLVVDGAPVVTGVLPLGDSWACTNPSVGRGISIGMIHAVALRDFLRGAVDDPHKTAQAWDEATRSTVDPYYESTVAHDRHRLAEMQAVIDGRSYEGDAGWQAYQQLAAASGDDPDLFRAFLTLNGVLATADEVLAQPDVAARAAALGADWRDAPAFGPTREQAVAIAGG